MQENTLFRRTSLSLYWIFLSFLLRTWFPLSSSWSPRFSGEPFPLAVLPQPSLCDMTWSKWHTTCQSPVIFSLGMLQCAVYSQKLQQKKKTLKCVFWHTNWSPLGKQPCCQKGGCRWLGLLHVECQCHLGTMPSSVLDYEACLQRLSRKHRKRWLIPSEAVVVFLRQSKLPIWRKIFKV